mgnify:CR=1 FL=1
MSINNNQTWALSLQKEDLTLQERLRKQMDHIKKSKNTLMDSAEQYSTKYQSEVVEGTKKLQRLLEDGRRKGKTDQEILDSQTVFCPSVRTPILNMLYFLLREHPDAHKIDLNRLQEDIGKDMYGVLNELNAKYGSEYHESTGDNVENAPEMEEFIYGEMTSKTYQTIKKLKSLSQSSNKAEAFSAYTKCLEMCKKYNLEFDKVKI